MTEASRQNPYLLPERARLFHVGLPKTGTTELQFTAARLRELQLAHGVLYPKTEPRDNRWAIGAFMGADIGWGRGVPSMEPWDHLMRVIEADTENRIWFSQEFAADATDEIAQRFRDALGERLHIVVTTRDYGGLVVSSWQESVKAGMRTPFERWLKGVLSDPPDPDVTPKLHIRNEQGRLVERWARVVGPENVTVIVVDKNAPNLISESFEDLLGLPRGLLRPQLAPGQPLLNRSLTVEEANLMRALSAQVNNPESPWHDHSGWILQAVRRALAWNRTPLPSERRLMLPQWAAEAATERSRRQADEIAASGVRVIGDLDRLRQPTPFTTEPHHNDSSSVPNEAALDLMLASIENTYQQADALTRSLLVSETSAAELLREIARRARRRLLRR